METPEILERWSLSCVSVVLAALDCACAVVLIGERPGLGRADSLSAYMAYRPKAGDTDAERDVICNIFDGGGANPLEAGAYALRLAQRMREKQASGVKLRLMEA